jgi:hypothetical protein
VVPPPSEWSIHSTGLDLQLQSDWPRRVPSLQSCNPSILTAHCPGAAFAYTVFITELLKWTVGRPRPDWLSRCKPDLTKIQSALTGTAVAMFDRSICTSTDRETLDEGQKSFLLVTQVVGVSTNTERSGGTHSIYPIDTFAGLTYLALFLSTRFKLFVPMGRRRTHTFLFFVSFSPMVVAGFVGATRVSDFQHHGLDVLAGATLGITVALIAYRHWNPWVTDRSAAIPWDVLHMDEIKKRNLYDVLPTTQPKGEPTTPTSIVLGTSIELGPSLQNQLAADPRWIVGRKREEEHM